MPEYLSPNVYVEEVPSELKAIEGVSTSTAAFVGRAHRGPVPGYAWKASTTPGLPYTTAGDFTLEPDPSPVLVTSFAEFQRQFGPPLDIPRPGNPDDYGYLGWAVRSFFNNGGKRTFIARIVDPNDQPARLQGAQGLAYRLLRSSARGDQTVFLKSNRGLSVGDALTFMRHSDGQNAVGSPVKAAVVSGWAEPFGMTDGDQVTVKPTPPLVAVTATVTAHPATLLIPPGGPTYPLVSGDTLVLRIGAATAPLQTIVFSATDLNAPISPGLASVAQVLAVLQRYLRDASVFLSGGQVAIESDLRGTSTRIQVVSGTALGALGLVAGSTPPPAGGNVADVDHVAIAELSALLPSADFTVNADPAGRIRFSTVATGAAVTIEVVDASATGVLQKLGLGSGASVMASGAAAVPTTLTITNYNPQSGAVTFSAAVDVALDATDVYATVLGSPTVPNTAFGPRFYARSPGSWGNEIRVQISNSDKQAVAIRGTVPIAAGATTLSVQNTASFYAGAVVEIDYSNNARSTHEVVSVNGGARQITLAPPTTAIINPLGVPAPTVRTLEIDLLITETTGSAPAEAYRGLSWNQGLNADVRRHYASVINPASRLVWVQPPGIGVPVNGGGESASLASQPTTVDGFPMSPDPLTLGTDSFTANEAVWVGTDNGPGQRSGIESLKDLSEVRLIAAPGKVSPEVQLALVAQCELMRYRFAILDGERDPAGGAITSILTHRSLHDTSFAAYYEPWIAVTVDGQTAYLPPSGHMAGVYARTDNTRGVWKAPANESVLTALALKTEYTNGEQDLLNPRGVNLIRRFDIGGIRAWGARTLSSDPDVKYINVRRTLIFLEASIDRGTQWVVFEPNTPDTWTRLKDSVGAFLLTQWRSGALFGDSPAQAFFVRCGEDTMTSDDILNGRLICEIGVAIVRPAEFVIFRIQQITKFFAD